MTKIWKNFIEYVTTRYSNAEKIVEVGVGNIYEPSRLLTQQMPDTEVLTVDIKPTRTETIKDDITNPTRQIYEDANLIYSIRPPEELQPHILRLAVNHHADALIKPFSSEEINPQIRRKMKMINYKKMVFYTYEGE